MIEYSSVDEASNLTGQSARTIGGKCRGILKQDSTCFWRYKINDDKPEKKNSSSSRAVNQLALDGTLIATYPSITEAVRNYRQLPNQIGYIYGSNISECCKGRRDSIGGFRWEYVTKLVKFKAFDPAKQIKQYSTEGVHIKDFDDIDQVATELKILPKNITKCCKLKQRSTNKTKHGTDSRQVIPLSVAIFYAHYQHDGTLIERYTSLKTLSRNLKINENVITNYSLGYKKTPDGTIWKREVLNTTTGNYIAI